MADAISVSGPISGTDKTISFETGKLAGLSNGAVIAKIGSTQVLVTATASSKPRDGADFFPLTVDIEERMYAAGRIPGSFFRREGRASDDAILACRLIDRPLRPNFPSEYRHDTHVVGTILGVDGENPYDVIALNGASAALWVSGIPFESPIAAVRIAYNTEGSWIPFPTYQEGEAATFEMVVAGRQLQSGDIAIMMVEAGGTERAFEYYDDGAPKVTEEVLADGLEASKQWIDDVIELQKGLRSQLGDIEELEWTPSLDYNDEILARVRSVATPQLTEVMAIADKAEREARQDAASAEIQAQLEEEFAETTDASKQIRAAVRSVSKEIVRRRIVEDGFRIDGRATDEVRPLSAEVSYIGETAHGSGLFQRGETQVLNVTTLGMSRMEQLIDTLNPNDRKRYMHHYNFPPFSTGEARPIRGTSRREIGHGNLAQRALKGMVPDDCPYTVRVVSEVLESNGSSSMATVCSGTMAMMDAGVQLKKPVSGIAMGLISDVDSGKYAVLSDILGDEDHLGDMDFKVTGTADGITACQMDIKVKGLSYEILVKALKQARDGRLHILDKLTDTISVPAQDVKPHAPKMVTRVIPNEFIGALIGPGGKVIQELQKETGTTIVINEDPVTEEGIVEILGTDQDGIDAVIAKIDSILFKPEVGSVYEVKVIKMLEFGAVVEYVEAPGNEVLLHVSELAWERTENVSDVVNMGDVFDVKYFGIDSRTRKEKVSRKALLPKPEGYVERPPKDKKPNNRGRDNRRNDRKPRRD